MEFIRHFKDLGKNDAALAGGKGASLGEMTKAGIPVPPGFVILAESFEYFIRETDLVQEIDTVIHSVKHQEIHTVESASEKIKSLILSREMPAEIASEIVKNFEALNSKFVAVRSSATAEDGADHAWAGQLESYLNTEAGELLTNVKRCWASLFTPRAIFYRFEKGLHTTKISVAVVVQKMVESETSGIAFSVHPVTEDYNQLIIEAGLGLGEAIVSGSVTPDSYVVEKEPRRIIDVNVATQTRGLYRSTSSRQAEPNEWREISEPRASSQVLTEAEILKLSDIILTIENHYSFPCDIEWAYEAGQFYIVQSRPITTLSNKKLEPKDHFPTANDYVLTFETQGTTPIFEDLAGQHYMPAESISFFDGQSIKAFISKKTITKMQAEGESFSTDDTQKIIKKLKGLINRTESEIPQYKNKKDFTREDAGAMFEVLTSVCKDYAYFDFNYWDGLYEKSKTDPAARGNIKLIEAFKNEIRADLGPVFFSPKGYLGTLLNCVAEKMGVQPDTLRWYLKDEIISLLEGKKVAEEKITARQKAFVYHKDASGQTHFYDGDQALHQLLQFGKVKEEPTGDTLYGKYAHSTGKKVIGRVKVITANYRDFDLVKNSMSEMNQGDILVSQTTAPELMEAFKKAAAVITDVGGMLSHAAITSRELNIPCVIGTKNGTKILKDGDMVEVDADTGTVKKI